jgi:hypothetical protein
MFNFKNNDSDIVIPTDADFTEKEYNHYIIYKDYEFLKSKKIIDKIYFHGHGRILHAAHNDKLIVRKKKYIIPYIIGTKLFGHKKIPNEILTNFLIYIEENSDKKVLTTYKIKENIKIKKCESYNKINICFGIDEYFINNFLIDYLIEKKLGLSFYMTYNILNPLYFKNPLTTGDYEHIPKYNEYLKEISTKHTPNITYNTYDKIDSMVHVSEVGEFTPNKIQNDIYKNIIKLYKKTNEKKEYEIFEKNLLSIFNMKEFKNVIRMSFYYFYFIDHEKIIISKVKLNK